MAAIYDNSGYTRGVRPFQNTQIFDSPRQNNIYTPTSLRQNTLTKVPPFSPQPGNQLFLNLKISLFIFALANKPKNSGQQQ